MFLIVLAVVSLAQHQVLQDIFRLQEEANGACPFALEVVKREFGVNTRSNTSCSAGKPSHLWIATIYASNRTFVVQSQFSHGVWEMVAAKELK